jgi:hypothetical protein
MKEREERERQRVRERERERERERSDGFIHNPCNIINSMHVPSS